MKTFTIIFPKTDQTSWKFIYESCASGTIFDHHYDSINDTFVHNFSDTSKEIKLTDVFYISYFQHHGGKHHKFIYDESNYQYIEQQFKHMNINYEIIKINIPTTITNIKIWCFEYFMFNIMPRPIHWASLNSNIMCKLTNRIYNLSYDHNKKFWNAHNYTEIFKKHESLVQLDFKE